MSWTETRNAISLDTLRTLEPTPGLSAEQPNNRDQFDAARAAAVAIVESGSVGDPAEHVFNVMMHGHGNPGHRPADGSYIVDAAGVTVSQATAQLDRTVAL